MRRAGIGVFVLLACLSAPARGGEAGPKVFAASSLAPALEVLAQHYAPDGHARPVIVPGASARLARQIEAGAPAAIFISADPQWVSWLAARGRIAPGTEVILACNRLVLAVSASGPALAGLSPAAGLRAALRAGRLILADPDSVPAGLYARQALTHLGLWEAARAAAIFAPHAQAARAWLARGEAAAGILYASDLHDMPQLRALPLPEASHDPILYLAALIGEESGAGDFLGFLRGPGAGRLAAYGFRPPGESGCR